MKTTNELRHVAKKLLAAYDTQDSHENLPHAYLGGDAGRAFRHGAAAAKNGIWTIYNRAILLAKALEDLVDDMDHVDRLLDDARTAGNSAGLVEGNDLVEPAGPDFTDFNAAYDHWADADGYWWLAQGAFYMTVAGWGVDPDLLPEIPEDAHSSPPDGIHLPRGDYAYPDPPRPKNHGFVDPEAGPTSHDTDPPVTTSAASGTPGTGNGGGGAGGDGGRTGHDSQPGGGHPAAKHHEPQLTPGQRHLLREQIHEQRQEVRRLQHQIDALEKDAPEPGDPAAAAYHAQIRTLQSQIQLRHDQIATLEHQLHPHAGDHHPGHQHGPQHGHGGGRGHLEATAHLDHIAVGDGTEDAQHLTDPLAPAPAPEAASVALTDDPAAASSGDDAGTPNATGATPTPGSATDPATAPTAGTTPDATSDATGTDPVAADDRQAHETTGTTSDTTTQAPSRARLAARLGGADQA